MDTCLIVFVMASTLLDVNAQYSVVICADPTKIHMVECGFDGTINILEYTVAIVPNTTGCTVEGITEQIDEQPSVCSMSNKYKTDEEVYLRCDGERSCTLDSSIVGVVILAGLTDICGDTDTNVVRFTFSCVKGDVALMAACLTVICSIVVAAVIFICKFGPKKERANQEKQTVGLQNIPQPNSSLDEAANQEPYEVITDEVVGNGTGNTDQLPVNDIPMATETTTTYDEVAQNPALSTEKSKETAEELNDGPAGVVNAAGEVEDEGNDVYEIISEDKPYEALKKSENGKEMEEAKVYTGLENTE